MKLGKCSECGKFIDLDAIDELDDDEIIGCGFAEGDFAACDDCACKYDSIDCRNIRRTHELSITIAKEYCK